MYFTEAEQLILSSLGYVEPPKEKFDKNGYPLPGQKVYIEDLLEDLKNQAKSCGYSEAEFNDPNYSKQYEAAIDSLKDKIGDWEVTNSISNNGMFESGLGVFSIEPPNNTSKEVLICCRGSDGLSIEHLNDWLGADIPLATTNQTTQQAELRAFMERFNAYDEVNLCGHSLGGNLAMYGAITFNDPSKIGNVYAFDAPGFSPSFVSEYANQINSVNSKIFNYQNKYDAISSYGISVGNVIIIESSLKSDDMVDNHNRYAFALAGGKLKRSKDGKSKKAVISGGSAQGISIALSLMIPQIPIVREIAAVMTIKHIIDYYNWRASREKQRDFTESTRIRMINAAKEVESEQWWQIDRWDIWYKIEDFFGGLEWDLYSGKVDNYYRKLIDINDASVEKIKQIFENVYSIDNDTSSSINSKNSFLLSCLDISKQIAESITPRASVSSKVGKAVKSIAPPQHMSH